eukprot:GFUD01106339.1.p1 GENE.GFUD01106339.1~~GFUD01106339.1.p1  ORF type:complete len:980 (+),score=297.62 GFUD01106339.1:77-3016(+)
MLTTTVRKVFRSHGEFCSTQPWEVIVATLTFLVCILTVWGKHSDMAWTLNNVTTVEQTTSTNPPTWSVMELVVMTFIRCLALLHCYYHFKKVHRVGSSLIMKITLGYLSFTMLLYSLVVFGLIGPEFDNVKESWFLIMLFTDIPKVTRMAQFALTSSHQRRIPANVAVGMAQLGPMMTFETVGKVLLVGLCGLTNYKRLELLATYAVITVVVDFLIFMSFFPAGLSLVIELMFNKAGRPQWDVKQIIKSLPTEETQNPVVYRVRVIAMTGLVTVHTLCRWPVDHSVSGSARAASYISSEWLKLVVANAEQFCILAVVLALAVKYLFYEDWEENFRIRKTYLEELERKFDEASESDSVSVDTNTSERSTLRPHTHEMDRSSNSTDEGISLSTISQRRMSATFERRLSSSLERRLSGSKTHLGHSRAVDRVSLNLAQCDTCSDTSAWSEVYMNNDMDSKEVAIQTNLAESGVVKIEEEESDREFEQVPRDVSECLKVMNASPEGTKLLLDSEVIQLVEQKHIAGHQLEKSLADPSRGVRIRRKIYGKQGNLKRAMENLPYQHYDYQKVLGACCENVVGYMPVPVGVVGPLNLDGRQLHIPMATTEGCLVASTNRGCRALQGCGVTTAITYDGMTRGPVVRFPCMTRATDAMKWMDNRSNFENIKTHFDSTSRFARLQRLHVRVAGRSLYIRFVAKSGDAMGMNMLSKATEFAINRMLDVFPDMEIVSLSGNFCTDKKPAAVNWVEGRGKSVVAEAIVPAHIVRTVLKTSTSALVDLNISKNLVGSSMAGSIGGFNAHAANIITAIYIATGQDAAQNVGSSNCITLMEAWGEYGEDLYMTCSMPSIEVGTVGGGTVLPAQSACLEMLGVKGPHPTMPGENASQLARLVCGTVLAGELSLMSALAAGHLVRSHLKHNRSAPGNLAKLGEVAAQVERPLSSSTPVPKMSKDLQPMYESSTKQSQPSELYEKSNLADNSGSPSTL